MKFLKSMILIVITVAVLVVAVSMVLNWSDFMEGWNSVECG